MGAPPPTINTPVGKFNINSAHLILNRRVCIILLMTFFLRIRNFWTSLYNYDVPKNVNDIFCLAHSNYFGKTAQLQFRIRKKNGQFFTPAIFFLSHTLAHKGTALVREHGIITCVHINMYYS